MVKKTLQKCIFATTTCKLNFPKREQNFDLIPTEIRLVFIVKAITIKINDKIRSIWQDRSTNTLFCISHVQRRKKPKCFSSIHSIVANTVNSF